MKLAAGHQHWRHGDGSPYCLIWASTCSAMVCVPSAELNSTVTPAGIEPLTLAATNVSPTLGMSVSMINTPGCKTCESHTNCASCFNASVSNNACFWIECKEDKSYCLHNSTISYYNVMNSTNFCSGPTEIPVPTNSRVKVTTLPFLHIPPIRFNKYHLGSNLITCTEVYL